MNDGHVFAGFPKECVKFFRELKANNDRAWFEHHRKEYEQYVKKPAEAFIVEMGSRLKTLSRDIIAIPRTNKSLFRINRDTRFSTDKSPYKTNLGIYFWQAPYSKMESSGLYFHLDPPKLMLAAGIYMMTKPVLSKYRRTIADDTKRKALLNIMRKIQAAGEYEIGGKTYKKIPAGYDANIKGAELLLHSGLYTYIEMKIPAEFYTAECIEFCYAHFKIMLPLHLWHVELLRGN